MPSKNEGQAAKTSKQEQKAKKLIDEFAGLSNLEKLGVGVKSKAEKLIQQLEDAEVLEKSFGSWKKANLDNKWKKDIEEWKGHARPNHWFEEAENSGLLKGKGKCAKRLKKLAKRDRRKLKKATESRKKVMEQLGEDLWEHGIIGLAKVAKPRAVKKQIPALG